MFISEATESNQEQSHNSANNISPVMQDETNPESQQYLDETTDVSRLFAKTYQLMETFAATHVGQYMLKRGDLMLRTFEETAKWSLPADNPDSYLMRPLPWLPFIMLIVVLRFLLMYLSIGALLLGDGPVTAKKFIYFIQTRRRKLRSIRMHGLKVIQQREDERRAQNTVAQNNNLMAWLGSLFNTIVCRPQSCNEEVNAIVVTRDSAPENTAQSNTELDLPAASKSPSVDRSPLMSCKEMLNKFANQDSDEDSDYMPDHDEEDSINDESYTSVSSSNETHVYNLDTSDENAKDLSLTEKDQRKETKSPQNLNMSTIEVKHVDADHTNNSDSKNTQDDCDNKETNSAESGKIIPTSPKTPFGNGGANNGGLAAAVEVVQVQEVAKPQNALFVNILNGDADVQKKSTPGHETAAHSKPHLPPPLLGNVVNANLTTIGMLVDANADCFVKENEIPANKPTTQILTPLPSQQPAPMVLHSSPSYSTTSSNSSLASFMTSDDLVDIEGRSRPPTPTPLLNTSSSLEDVYQSPFGSPPDFSPFTQAPPSLHIPLLGCSETEASPNGDHSVHADDEFSKSKHFKPNLEQKTLNPKQQQQKYQQRYRNRNRR